MPQTYDSAPDIKALLANVATDTAVVAEPIVSEAATTARASALFGSCLGSLLLINSSFYSRPGSKSEKSTKTISLSG